MKGDEIESSVLQLQHLLQLDLGVVGPVALRSVVATCTRQVRSARPKRVDLGGGLPQSDSRALYELIPSYQEPIYCVYGVYCVLLTDIVAAALQKQYIGRM